MKPRMSIALFSLLGGLAACGQGPDAPAPALSPEEMNRKAEQDFNLLAKLTTPEGNIIEFYEPQPGLLIVAEESVVPQGSVIQRQRLRERSFSDVYRVLAPGRAVPETLLAAERRALSLGQVPRAAAAPLRSGTRPEDAPAPPAAPRAPGDGVGAIRSAVQTGSCPAAWFVAEGFCPNNFGYTWCLTNWWNGAYQSTTSTTYSIGAVCADIGDVVMKVTSGGDGGTWTVPQGHVRQYYKYGDPFLFWRFPFSIRYEVNSASGDRFQFGGAFE